MVQWVFTKLAQKNINTLADSARHRRGKDYLATKDYHLQKLNRVCFNDICRTLLKGKEAITSCRSSTGEESLGWKLLPSKSMRSV